MREIQYELCDFPTPQIRDARWPEIFWRFLTEIGSSYATIGMISILQGGDNKTYQLADEFTLEGP